jgi:hypothetical protein
MHRDTGNRMPPVQQASRTKFPLTSDIAFEIEPLAGERALPSREAVPIPVWRR